MQAINVAAVTPLFTLALFGTVPACIAAAVLGKATPEAAILMAGLDRLETCSNYLVS